MLTRRQLIQTGALAGTAAFASPALLTPDQALAAPLPGRPLDPTSIPKYVTILVRFRSAE
ncbi:MAG: twin-arginine translocation signal domain-containing protein [Streptosporangiales bacterium]|nr:twin-arginine translocation signal domain-containing protein [Streptosporangiales bacterium]